MRGRAVFEVHIRMPRVHIRIILVWFLGVGLLVHVRAGVGVVVWDGYSRSRVLVTLWWWGRDFRGGLRFNRVRRWFCLVVKGPVETFSNRRPLAQGSL